MRTPTRKIVFTGGPCAGKTTLTEIIDRVFGARVARVPEAASLLFSGGFPRWNEPAERCATQRAIFQVQRELEAAYEAHFPDKVLILDRSTIDGAAYWPEGTDHFFEAMGTSLEREYARYDRVFYLESADQEAYLTHARSNPNRIETWEAARLVGERTRQLWAAHPKYTFIQNERSFDRKIAEILDLIKPSLRESGLPSTDP